MLGIMNGLRQLLYYLLNKASLFANMSRSHHHSYSQLITNLTNVFAGFLYPTMHQTQANLSKKWLQSQTKNLVKHPSLGMGVASILNNRPFPNAQNRAKPGSVKRFIGHIASNFTIIMGRNGSQRSLSSIESESRDLPKMQFA